ncbi:hypothetical protein KKH36_01075 [Patescibacteria group bacterium]|nr:hypothetical protein [Patescibacteria group bacterium]
MLKLSSFFVVIFCCLVLLNTVEPYGEKSEDWKEVFWIKNSFQLVEVEKDFFVKLPQYNFASKLEDVLKIRYNKKWPQWFILNEVKKGCSEVNSIRDPIYGRSYLTEFQKRRLKYAEMRLPEIIGLLI